MEIPQIEYVATQSNKCVKFWGLDDLGWDSMHRFSSACLDQQCAELVKGSRVQGFKEPQGTHIHPRSLT